MKIDLTDRVIRLLEGGKSLRSGAGKSVSTYSLPLLTIYQMTNFWTGLSRKQL